MLGGCAATVAAFTAGCAGDDGEGDDTAGDTGSGTSGPASGSGDNGMSATPTAQNETGGSSGGGGESEDDGTTGSASTGPDDADTGSGDEMGSESGSTGGAAACDAMVVATISNNHGHALSIPLADIDAGVEQAYDASGDAHCHEVVLTAEDFATLRAGGVVVAFSCNGGPHEFVICCAPGAPEPQSPPPGCGGADPGHGSCPD